MAKPNSILGEIASIPGRLDRGRALERLSVWLFRNLPEYRQQLADAWCWDDWPDRDGPDRGVDVVGALYHGGLWLIQAKAYEGSRNLAKKDVDSLIAEAQRLRTAGHDIRALVVVTTAKGISRNAEADLDAASLPWILIAHGDLLAHEPSMPATLAGLAAPVKVERHTPFPHQAEAVEAVCRGFGVGAKRGQAILACGTGKTMVGLWVHERLDARRTLVFVPSILLLSQTLREWARHGTKNARVLAICSDEGAGQTDEAIQSVHGLCIPATTDPRRLAEAMMEVADDRLVVFSTYQSSAVVQDACSHAGITFDLMLLDEAHRTTGMVGSPFTLPLDNLHLPAERRLFMTATPRTFTARVKKRADEVELVVASMDDVDIYGEELHHLSFADAIERDLLSDYRVVVMGVKEAEAKRFLAENALVRTTKNETYAVRSAVAFIALAKTMRRFGERSILTFHSRVAAAQDFAANLPAFFAWSPEDHRPAGTIEAYAVHGKMPMLQRAQVLRRLAEADTGRAVVVANAKCLSEGVDVPTLDGLLFVDPRKSEIDIVQAVGRAMRKSVKGDGISTIILPLMIGEHDDPEEIAASEGFGVVLDVLMALKSHDSRLAEEIDLLQRSRGRTGTVGRISGERLQIELPVELPREAFDWLTIRVLDRVSGTMERGFGALERFVEREGHARVARRHVEDGVKLGTWVTNRRVDYRKGKKLDPEYIARLEALPGWSWDPFADQFREAFGALERFVEREGHAKVPQRHVEDGVSLGRWVTKRRVDYRSGKLDPEYIARLEALPGWVWDAKS